MVIRVPGVEKGRPGRGDGAYPDLQNRRQPEERPTGGKSHG